MTRHQLTAGLVAGAVSILLAACGGASKPMSQDHGSTQAGGSTQVGGGGPGALSAEAQSAATGDIPDNQVFLTLRNQPAGYSISYPEGWAQRGTPNDTTFQDKNNIIHVVVSRGAPPTAAAVASQLARERQRQPSLTAGSPSTLSIQSATVVKVTYSTVSQPSPVTGKRVQLLVDRYVYARGGKVAVVDLGTPKGVDNVDAYRMISRSFRWL